MFRLRRDGVPSSAAAFTTSDLKQERMRPEPARPEPLALKNVTSLPAPTMSDHNGEHWKAPIDLVRELLHDMETGAVNPDMIFVALQQQHDGGGISYPSYCWSDARTNGLIMMGLLTRHIQKMGEELKGDTD
jgi:hypothetical protein